MPTACKTSQQSHDRYTDKINLTSLFKKKNDVQMKIK